MLKDFVEGNVVCKFSTFLGMQLRKMLQNPVHERALTVRSCGDALIMIYY